MRERLSMKRLPTKSSARLERCGLGSNSFLYSEYISEYKDQCEKGSKEDQVIVTHARIRSDAT